MIVIATNIIYVIAITAAAAITTINAVACTTALSFSPTTFLASSLHLFHLYFSLHFYFPSHIVLRLLYSSLPLCRLVSLCVFVPYLCHFPLLLHVHMPFLSSCRCSLLPSPTLFPLCSLIRCRYLHTLSPAHTPRLYPFAQPLPPLLLRVLFLPSIEHILRILYLPRNLAPPTLFSRHYSQVADGYVPFVTLVHLYVLYKRRPECAHISLRRRFCLAAFPNPTRPSQSRILHNYLVETVRPPATLTSSFHFRLYFPTLHYTLHHLYTFFPCTRTPHPAHFVFPPAPALWCHSCLLNTLHVPRPPLLPQPLHWVILTYFTNWPPSPLRPAFAYFPPHLPFFTIPYRR